MNWKRVLIGGLAAGLLINALDWIVGFFVLADKYAALQKTGLFFEKPVLPFVPLWVLGQFAIGLILAGLYAAVRPRLGPGARTALIVGLTAGLLTHVPYNFVTASWSPAGRYIPLISMVAGILELILGALLAGYLYREKG